MKAPQANQHRTLLDGILVEDMDPTDRTLTRRFLIFDIITYEGGIMAWRPFSQRQKCIIDGIIEPRKRLEGEGGYDFSGEPIRIRRKDFFEIDKAGHLIDTFAPKLTHESDGIVFVNKDHRYVVGKEGEKGKRWLKWGGEGEGEVKKEDVLKKIEKIMTPKT